MPGERNSIWLPAAATAAVTLVVAAGAAYGVINWALPKAQHYLDDRFAAVDTKIELSSRSALSALTSLPSLASTVKEIETLNAKIKKTNDTLDAIQKQISQATMKAELAPLDGKLDKAYAAIAAIQSEMAQAKPDEATGKAALARIEKTVNTLKDALAGTASAAKLQDTVAKLDDVSAGLAKLQGTAAKLDELEKAVNDLAKIADAFKSGLAANASALAETHKSLTALDTAVKDGFANATSARSALKDDVAKLAQPAEPATTGSAKKPGEDLLVLYVAAPAAGQQDEPPRAGAIPPMTIHYEKVGSTDDEGQTALIVKKLRPILKKHRGCSIAVAGHADTLGNDDLNHRISQRRAQKVAAKLKEAFAKVPVTNTAWGERKLKEWTDDETPDATNRRVDVMVRCAS